MRSLWPCRVFEAERGSCCSLIVGSVEKQTRVWCHSPETPSAFFLNPCSLCLKRSQRYASAGAATVTIGLLMTNTEGHMSTGFPWLDAHGCSKAWHKWDADSYCGGERTKKQKRLERNWEVKKRLRMCLWPEERDEAGWCKQQDEAWAITRVSSKWKVPEDEWMRNSFVMAEYLLVFFGTISRSLD